MDVHSLLPAGARPALERAMRTPVSYVVRFVIAPGPEPRVVVILGEAHVKMQGASKLGRDVVRCFDLRGVETFQRDSVFAGRMVGALINAPRLLVRGLSLGAVKGSTITDAKEIATGTTVELERSTQVPLSLHVGSAYLAGLLGVSYATFLLETAGIAAPWLPTISRAMQLHLLAAAPAFMLRRRPWAWLVHPVVAIVSARDTLMAEGTVRMLRDFPGPSAAVVVMGRAHVSGYERELVEKHGFARAEL